MSKSKNQLSIPMEETTSDEAVQRIVFVRDNKGPHVIVIDKARLKEVRKPRSVDNDALRKLQEHRGVILEKLRLLRDAIQDKEQKQKANELIQHFFKLGFLHIDEKNVTAILETACELSILRVQDACVTLLSRSLTVGNWLETLRAARLSRNAALRRQVLSYLRKHTEECLQKTDVVSALTSLAWNKEDLASFRYLLMKLSAGEGGKRSGKMALRLLLNVMRKDLLAWRCYFKAYLNEAETEWSETHMQENRTSLAKPEQFTIKGIHQKIGVTKTPAHEATAQGEGHYLSRNMKHPYGSGTLNTSEVEETAQDTSSSSSENCIKATTLRPRLGDIENTNCTLAEYVTDILDQSIAKAKPLSHDGIILTGGLYYRGGLEASAKVFFYYPEARRWEELLGMTTPRFNHGMTLHKGNIYILGGAQYEQDYSQGAVPATSPLKNPRTSYKDSSTNNQGLSWNRNTKQKEMRENHELLSQDKKCIQLNSVERFNPTDSRWESMPTMILPRSELCTAVVRGCLYSIGGDDGVGELCSMERLCSNCSEWGLVSPMPCLRTGSSASVYRDKLYVIGGFDGTDFLDTMVVYDNRSRSWSSDRYPFMSERRAYAQAVIFRDNIFIIGGMNRSGCLCSCEVFHIRTNAWSKGKPMNKPRMNATACLFKGRIFVFGGETDGKFLDSVESYDGDKQWVMESKMPMRMAGMRCAALHSSHYSP